MSEAKLGLLRGLDLIMCFQGCEIKSDIIET